MKLLLVLCLLAVASAQPTALLKAKNKSISDCFELVLESLRELMRNGNSESGIPVLDPLEIDTFSFSFNANDMLSADISATEINFSGLSDFIADSFRVSIIPLGVHFEFSIPHAKLLTETYRMNGMLFGALPIYGNGKTHFEVDNFHVKGFANIQVGLSGLLMRDLRLELNLDKLTSETTGMIGGGDIDNVINAIIGDMAADFFNAYSDLIADRVKGMIIPIANEVLQGWTLQDLLDMINGGGGTC